MKEYFLPFRYKRIGFLLVITGMAGLIWFLLSDLILILPVFAVVSSFLETKTFEVVRTNVADELIMFTLLAGFFLVVFSKEKQEHEGLDRMRFKAIAKALWANAAMLLFSILFFYGQGFLAVLLLNLFSVFIFYLVFFFFEKRKCQ